MTIEEHMKIFNAFNDSNPEATSWNFYFEGMMEEYRAWKKRMIDLRGDIEHSGFDKDCVLLAIEDWLAE